MAAGSAGEPQLVLFDGVCNVCNAAVLFIIDRDPHERFVFAPLDSAVGRAALAEHHGDSSDTIVLIARGRTYLRSSAALQIARQLTLPWPFLAVFWLVPRALRDRLYRAFAARRYVWFGKSESCRVPTPALRRRFIT